MRRMSHKTGANWHLNIDKQKEVKSTKNKMQIIDTFEMYVFIE